MHWLLDVRFSEDMCRVCRLLDKNLQQALNIGRKVALNLVSRYKQKNAPKSSLSHIMFKALMYISFIKKILQNWFPCKFLNRIRGGNGLRTRMRFKNWRPCQFLNCEFLLYKNSAWLLYTAVIGGTEVCVYGWTRYKSSRCLYANCVSCTVSVQTRV